MAKYPCFQHRRRSQDGIGKFENVTRVTDYADPPDPAGIAPYPAPILVVPSCATAPDCSAENPQCESISDLFIGCSGSSVSIENNCYQPAGTVDLSHCRWIGFNVVQARRSWHGSFGFTSEHWHPQDNAITVSAGVTCWCYPERPTADQTKYLVRSVESSHTVFDDNHGNPEVEFIATARRTVSVGANTGVTTLTDCEYDIADFNAEYGTDAASPLLDALFTFADTWNIGNLPAYFFGLVGASTYVRSGNTWTAYHVSTGPDDPGNGLKDAELVIDWAGNYSFTVWSYDGTGSGPGGYGAWIVLIQTTVAITSTEMTYRKEHYLDYDPTSIATGIRYIAEFTCTLSSPNPSASIYADLKTISDQWHLDDMVRCPFRADNFITVAPVVSRHESSGPVEPLVMYPSLDAGLCTVSGDAWVDPLFTDYGFDGGIRGGPMPAGYFQFFDDEHVTSKHCLDGGGFSTYYSAYRGAKSYADIVGDVTDSCVPWSATRWTENLTAGQLPSGGAWVIYNGAQVVLQKWAEVKISRPEAKTARPCGADRLLVEEGSAVCILAVTGTGVGAVLTTDSTPIANGTTCFVTWLGDSSLDGIWTVTRNSDTEFVLATFVAPLPSDYVPSDSVLGELRFNTAPGICGAIAITAATNASPIQITTSEAHTLRSGEFVDVSGVGGNTAANGTHRQITVIDAFNFTIDGSAGNADYTSGGSVSSYGATGSTDDSPLGKVVYLEWQINDRDYQERDAAIANDAISGCEDCENAGGAALRTAQAANGLDRGVTGITISEETIQWSKCDPQVLCVSPRLEDFGNAIVKLFPDEFLFDQTYGSRWHGQWVQWLTDELWQAPHKPCAVGSNEWIEDLGLCQEDDGFSNFFYPSRPYVEARAARFATYSEMTGAGPGDKIIPNPPLALGNGVDDYATPNTDQTPWAEYIAQHGCVCSDPPGRFASEYEANGTNCNTPPVP